MDITPQPFPDGSKVICINESPDYEINGEYSGSCVCTPPNIYDVEYMVWSSKTGWLIATPEPHKTIGNEMHMAKDFQLAPKMTAKEALSLIGRYEPCPHWATIDAGKHYLKCEDCGARLLKDSLIRAQESHNKFNEAIDILSHAINKPATPTAR